jgi:hypothetical protein
MTNQVNIKLFRDDPGSLESYGRPVLAALDSLVGGPDKWRQGRWHGEAKVLGTRVRVSRHEDGPELLGLLLTESPKIITAIAALAVAWCKIKGTRRVKLQVGKHKYEGPIEGIPQFKAMVRALEKLTGR